jgi:hypothetical protein
MKLKEGRKNRLQEEERSNVREVKERNGRNEGGVRKDGR